MQEEEEEEEGEVKKKMRFKKRRDPELMTTRGSALGLGPFSLEKKQKTAPPLLSFPIQTVTTLRRIDKKINKYMH